MLSRVWTRSPRLPQLPGEAIKRAQAALTVFPAVCSGLELGRRHQRRRRETRPILLQGGGVENLCCSTDIITAAFFLASVCLDYEKSGQLTIRCFCPFAPHQYRRYT